MEIKCPECNNYYNAAKNSCPFCESKAKKEPPPKETAPKKQEVKITTKQCKYCSMTIPIEAKICPHCQKRLKTSTGVWILTILFIIVGLATCSDCIKYQQ